MHSLNKPPFLGIDFPENDSNSNGDQSIGGPLGGGGQERTGRGLGLKARGTPAPLSQEPRPQHRRHPRHNPGGLLALAACPEPRMRIPRDGERCFHGMVNTDSTTT